MAQVRQLRPPHGAIVQQALETRQLVVWKLKVVSKELSGLLFDVWHFGVHGITLRFDYTYTLGITCWRSL